jgi:DNA-binding response OmpR family regulator
MRGDQYVILCVDDDPDVLEPLKLVLESDGYVFVGASSAEEGRAAYKASHPDLVMVDLMMEKIDAGTNLVKELQAMGNKAPIFLLSSVGDQLTQQIDSTDLGFAGVFQKPFDPVALLATLKDHLGK